MKIYRLISIADIFTLVNALLGFGAILLISIGLPVEGIYAILAGILADGLDGILARRFSRKWYLGDYLDVMADTTSFCVAPGVLVFSVARAGLPAIAGDYSVPVLFAACGASVVCGLLRLARFTYMSGGHSSTFTGLPSPGNALLLSLLALQHLISPSPLPGVLLVPAAFILAGLMVTDYRYPKVKGTFAYASGLVIFLVMLSRAVDVTHMLSEFLLDIALMLALAYVVLGPLAAGWKSRSAPGQKGC